MINVKIFPRLTLSQNGGSKVDRDEILTAAVRLFGEKARKLDRLVKRAIDDANKSPHRMEARFDYSREEHSNRAAEIGGQLENARDIGYYLQELERAGVHATETVTAGSVVEFMLGEEAMTGLILPFNGGDSIEVSGQTILTISLQSPLGLALINRQAGKEYSYTTPNGTQRKMKIVKIY